MLTEGWDTRTVTHILGYRAFSTQLLCEQVTGRALRRSNYDNYDKDGRLVAEYAEVIGVPFEFMPVKRPEDKPEPPKPRYEVRSIPGRRDHRIEFPNVEHYLTEPGADGFRLNPQRVITMGASGSHRGRAGRVGGRHQDHQRRSERPSAAGTHPVGRRTCTALVSAHGRQRERAGAPDGGCCSTTPSESSRSGLQLANVTEDQYDGLGSSNLDQAVKEIDDVSETTDGAQDRLVAAFGHPTLLDTSSIRFETSLSDRHNAKNSELNIAACHSQFEAACARALDKHPEVVSWGTQLPARLDGALPVGRHMAPIRARLRGPHLRRPRRRRRRCISSLSAKACPTTTATARNSPSRNGGYQQCSRPGSCRAGFGDGHSWN